MAESFLTTETLGQLKELLSEATRTDNQSAGAVADRFVELRPGTLQQLKSMRHHLVTGRRGTGKSTLLHMMRLGIENDGGMVAMVDMEHYKGRAYPDVLIEILERLLRELTPPFGFTWKCLKARHQTKSIRKKLAKLLTDPQSVEKHFTKTQSGSRQVGGGIGGGFAQSYLKANAEIATSSSKGADVTEQATFVELKIERLQQLASELNETLSTIVQMRPDSRCVIFIDDFYYVRMDDQPWVLDNLHQVIKGTGIWLKIGGVGTRLKPYRDSDPPLAWSPTRISTLSQSTSPWKTSRRQRNSWKAYSSG